MKHEIIGNNLQMVKIDLQPGEGIFAEAGSMVNMTGSFTMESQLKGGIISGLKRAVTGESIFLTRFTAGDTAGFVSFAGTMPGKIFPVTVSPDKDFIASKESFLCCDDGVDLEIALTNKIRAGLFGGEGFILQRMTGQGTVFLHCCGDIIEMTLKPGEVVKVQTGLVVGFDHSVSYDIALVGGITTAIFGGEGLFVTTLTGPGKVVLQSMDIAKLAASIIPYLPKPEVVQVKAV
ncbi:MAG: TIGR00266 family protein [Methanoregula sp.]|uniref:TIGR00266 family protein n=1 Tax=Methanoregula sp. TaxID=2052170 RepID=UPI0025ED7940|nr:TIGR00266 family protein [Methanoregula sp.]MCK9630944.1 TIGR00266 family protein [Methanoregula sp.]